MVKQLCSSKYKQSNNFFKETKGRKMKEKEKCRNAILKQQKKKAEKKEILRS